MSAGGYERSIAKPDELAVRAVEERNPQSVRPGDTPDWMHDAQPARRSAAGQAKPMTIVKLRVSRVGFEPGSMLLLRSR
jgi:hypothetical protein